MLEKDLNTSKRSAFAKGTNTNLHIQWESFLLFCFYFSFISVPASTETMSLYAQFLSRSFLSIDSIRNYISGVYTMHRLLGVDIVVNSYLINLALKGINRLHPHCPKRAAPITPAILRRFHSTLDFSKPLDVCVWCLFLFAFFLLARKSNLVLNSKTDNSGKYLLRRDVSLQGDMLVVSFRWSKTLQFGDRILQIPLIRSSSILCPVSAFENLQRLVPAGLDSPLFTFASGKALTYSMFQSKLKSLCSKVGLDPSIYSSHSFRRGGATLAFQSGVSSELIQLQGDWRSDAYKNYLSFTLNDKVEVARLMNRLIDSEM